MPSDEHASDLRTHEAARPVNFVDLQIFLSNFVEKNKLVQFTPLLANRTSSNLFGSFILNPYMYEIIVLCSMDLSVKLMFSMTKLHRILDSFGQLFRCNRF